MAFTGVLTAITPCQNGYAGLTDQDQELYLHRDLL